MDLTKKRIFRNFDRLHYKEVLLWARIKRENVEIGDEVTMLYEVPQNWWFQNVCVHPENLIQTMNIDFGIDLKNTPDFCM